MPGEARALLPVARLPHTLAAPRAGPAACPAALAAVPGGAGTTRCRSRPAPLFAVLPLPCAGMGLPGLPRALLAAAGAGAVALGRRRSEPLKAPRGGGGEGGGRSGGGGRRTAGGSQEQGRHVRLCNGASPPGRALRRRGAGGDRGVGGPAAACRPGERELNAAHRAAAAAPPLTLPPPGGGAAGGRRRPRAPSSVQRRQLASAVEGSGVSARLGAAVRPQVPGQPRVGEEEEEQRPPPCAGAVPRGSRYPPSPPPLPGHQKERAAPRWLRREGRVKPGWEGGSEGAVGPPFLPGAAAPGVREQRHCAPFCGFWGPSDLGALRGIPFPADLG